MTNFEATQKVFELSKILQWFTEQSGILLDLREDSIRVKVYGNRYLFTESEEFQVRIDGTVYGKLEP